MNNPSESIQAYLRTIRRCGRWICYRSAIELSMNWSENISHTKGFGIISSHS